MLGCTSLPKCVHTGPGPTPDYARWAVVPRSPTLKAHRRSLKDPSHRSTPAAPGPRRRLGAVLAVVSFPPPLHVTTRSPCRFCRRSFTPALHTIPVNSPRIGGAVNDPDVIWTLMWKQDTVSLHCLLSLGQNQWQVDQSATK